VAKYRKKPVIIEAIQLNWFNWDKVLQFAGVGRLEDGRPEGHVPEDGSSNCGLLIPTLEGVMLVIEGDWIIRGIKGELYPCKPDIFEATYEPVQEA